MADEVVNISLQADIKALEQELAKMPDIGAREAKKLVKELTTQYARAEKAARDSAKKQSTEWEKQLGTMSTVTERTLGKMGGLFGDLGDIIFDVVGPLGSVSAGLGAVAAVGGQVVLTTAVVSGLAVGVYELAEAASAAGDRLEKLKIDVGPDAHRDLEAYAQATSDLRIKLDELTVRAGSGAAGELAILARAVVDNADAAYDGLVAFNAFGVNLTSTAIPALGALRTVMAFEQESVYNALTASTRATVDATVEMRAFAEAARDASVEAAKLNNIEQSFPEFGPLQSQGGADEARLAREAAEARQDAADAARAEQEATALLVSDMLTVVAFDEARAEAREAQAILAQEQLAAEREAFEWTSAALGAQREIAMVQQELVRATEDYAGSWEQVGDVMLQVVVEMQDEIDAVAGTVSTLIDLAEGFAASEIDRLRAAGEEDIAQAEAAAAAKKKADEEEAYRQRALGLITEEQLLVDLAHIDRVYESEIAAAQREDLEEQRLAIKAFNRIKAIQRGEAVMEAAVAGVALIAGMAYLGPFAAAAAAVEAGLALGVALQQINSQKPPEFPMGMSPDHFPVIGTQRTEAVVNGRGVAAGHEAGIDFDALNRGVRPGSGRVTVVLGRRTLADAVYDVRREARVHVDRRRGKRDPHHGGRR